MKIGVIGLGNIAQKAYLPVLLTKYPTIDWHLCTRNKVKLENVGRQYRCTNLHTSLDELIEAKVDAVFVHTPTHTHGETIRRLLEAGIHVYVDKPVSENLKETKDLYDLAKKDNLLLVAGFNRRFAPMIQKLKQIKGKNMIIVQKNRKDSIEDSTKYKLFDLFIHPLDTALFLLDDVKSWNSNIIEENGNLKRAWITLETENTSCFVSVNCLAGANEEIVEVHSPKGIYKVKNLTELSQVDDNGERKERFGDWEDTLTKRGFEPIIDSFIQAVMHKSDTPVTAQSSLFSHQLCRYMLEHHDKKD